MAQRRMCSGRIIKSAKFLQMPAEAQNLYFHAIVSADDDGVVELYTLIKLLSCPLDNVKILFAKDYLRPLNDEQVVVITDWLEHNLIRPDRKINSVYNSLLRERYPQMKLIEPRSQKDQITAEISNGRTNGGHSVDK